MKGAVITEDDLKRMQDRVSGAVKAAAEPVRPILPARFTILGQAVSVNNSKVSFTGADGKTKTVKTVDAREWAASMHKQLRQQWGVMLPVECEVFVIMDFFFRSNRSDYNNGSKAVEDALEKAGILRNDRLIRRGTSTKHVDRDRPRVEVVIYESNLKPL